MDAALVKKVEQWIEENRDKILEDIISTVNIESVAQPDSPVGPFGPGCRRALDHVLGLADRLGFSTHNMDYYCGYADLGAGEKEIGVFGHLDVVPAGSDWTFDPYDATVRDGWIYGRGVMDDKGPTIAAMYAIACAAQMSPLKNRVRLFLGCCEETGMHCIKHYLKSQKPSDFAFAPDADFPVCIGEKGSLKLKLRSPKLDGSILSMEGGVANNVVPDRAFALLRLDILPEGRDNVSVERTPKGVKVTAHGLSSHASRPDGSVNAIRVLAEYLLEEGLVEGREKQACRAIVSMLADCHGAGLGIPFEDEVSGKLTHIAGRLGWEDGRILLRFDIRYPVTLDPQELKSSYEQYMEGAFFETVEYQAGRASYIPKDSPVVTALMDVYRQVTGDWDAQPYTMGGGTYAKHLPNAAAFGPEFPGLVPPVGPGRGGVHMPDEAASIKALMDSVKIYALAILEIDRLL